MSVSFKVRYQVLGGHVHVGVWSSEHGPDTTHGKNGTLTFRIAEWEAFQQILNCADTGMELIEADPGPS